MPSDIKAHHDLVFFVAVWELRDQIKLKEVIPTDDEKCDALGPHILGKTQKGSTLFDRYLNSKFDSFSNMKWISKIVEEGAMGGEEISGEAILESKSVQGIFIKVNVYRNYFALPFSIVSANGTTLYSRSKNADSGEQLISFDDRNGTLILNLQSTDPTEHHIIDLKTGKLENSIYTSQEYHTKLHQFIPKLFWAQIDTSSPIALSLSCE